MAEERVLVCAAVGCTNKVGAGSFVRELCVPCHLYVEWNAYNRGRTDAAWGETASDELDHVLPYGDDPWLDGELAVRATPWPMPQRQGTA